MRQAFRMKKRIYVCHTFYHVYVTFLKEFQLPKEEWGNATLLLSTMSNDFAGLKERVDKLHFFEAVYEYNEQPEEAFSDLQKYRHPERNFIKALWNRNRFTKKLGKYQEAFVPVNFKEYQERYVYCDSDPIGYYLNYKHIPYHALEDGLDTLVHFDAARYDNRGHFALKAFLSSKWNLIFVQNGYGKYCIDMEVNNISAIKHPCPKYVEVPRQPMVDALTREQKDILLRAFVKNMDALLYTMEQGEYRDNKVLVLTEPLCDLETREQIFRDIIAEYGVKAQIYLKPHPRDVLDYEKLFHDYLIIDKTVPMEMLNFIPNLKFEKVVSVLTVLDGISFADEKIRLGSDFMDQYEAPEVHRQNEQI